MPLFDLTFGLIGRFGAHFRSRFVDDWIAVGPDKAMPLALLDRQFRRLESHYGAMPAHDGLWDSARLAIVPVVLEARGLDVTPATTERFDAAADACTATISRRIFGDEIAHVAAGTRWFESACNQRGFVAETHWQMPVNRHFHSGLKPPFNDSARATAGLTRENYRALVLDGTLPH